MDSVQLSKLFEDFFQVFIKSINATLTKNLDEDTCNKIDFSLVSSSKVGGVEDLAENNAIYKLDYATGNRQGLLLVLIPEEVIAMVSDVLTGGEGKDAYKGSISEIEVNSILGILEKASKSIESDFKKFYEHDLVFSSNPSLLLKENPDYSLTSDGISLDFLISTKLTLIEGIEHEIKLLISSNTLENLLGDLGISDENSVNKKVRASSLDVEQLSDIRINITAELGRTRVPMKYALELVRGSLVELDTINNSDIKVFANGVEFAYAQVVAIGEHFGLKITKIIAPEERSGHI